MNEKAREAAAAAYERTIGRPPFPPMLDAILAAVEPIIERQVIDRVLADDEFVTAIMSAYFDGCDADDCVETHAGLSVSRVLERLREWAVLRGLEARS